jgi:hypothetical protein
MSGNGHYCGIGMSLKERVIVLPYVAESRRKELIICCGIRRLGSKVVGVWTNRIRYGYNTLGMRHV